MKYSAYVRLEFYAVDSQEQFQARLLSALSNLAPKLSEKAGVHIENVQIASITAVPIAAAKKPVIVPGEF